MSHAGTCDPGKDEELSALQMADLLAGEFSGGGETQIRSEALRIIGDKNKIGYLRCDPPKQHVPLLDLLNFGSHMRREVSKFLKLERQGLLSPGEAYERLVNLFSLEAFFNLQRKRLIEFLENDRDYQESRKKHIAATGIDPMILTDGEEEDN
jgi:hypothetical protein